MTFVKFVQPKRPHVECAETQGAHKFEVDEPGLLRGFTHHGFLNRFAWPDRASWYLDPGFRMVRMQEQQEALLIGDVGKRLPFD